jgi:hypothetical protein
MVPVARAWPLVEVNNRKEFLESRIQNTVMLLCWSPIVFITAAVVGGGLISESGVVRYGIGIVATILWSACTIWMVWTGKFEVGSLPASE